MSKPSPIFKPAVVITLMLAGFALSGCGIKGGLKTPPPIFGGASSKPLPPAPIEPSETDESDFDALDSGAIDNAP